MRIPAPYSLKLLEHLAIFIFLPLLAHLASFSRFRLHFDFLTFTISLIIDKNSFVYNNRPIFKSLLSLARACFYIFTPMANIFKLRITTYICTFSLSNKAIILMIDFSFSVILTVILIIYIKLTPLNFDCIEFIRNEQRFYNFILFEDTLSDNTSVFIIKFSLPFDYNRS